VRTLGREIFARETSDFDGRRGHPAHLVVPVTLGLPFTEIAHIAERTAIHLHVDPHGPLSLGLFDLAHPNMVDTERFAWAVLGDAMLNRIENASSPLCAAAKRCNIQLFR